jgi:histone arginine demethylase JMJD6
MQQIEKLDSISYEHFIENYLKPGIPVVFRNATANWKSKQTFTPDFFKEHFGQRTTTYKGTVYSMSEILDITKRGTPANPAPYPILFEIPVQLPELLPMMEPIHLGYAFPNWFRSKLLPYGKLGNSIHLFIGGAGNQYSLHKDSYHTNAWITQLHGNKKFVVFPREQEELMYAEDSGFISPINITKPDYDKYPKYRNATPISVVVEPGETIFIPNGIWHTTVASEHNISLIFDQLNSHNFKAWKKDIFDYGKNKNKLKAVASYSLAHTIGSLCKLGEITGNKFQS